MESTLSFPKFVATCKKSVYSIHSLLRYCQFLSLMTRLATPIFGHVHPKNILSSFDICEFAKTQLFFHWFVLIKISNILQSDWLRTFWTTSQEQKFPKIWDLCRNTVNIINFHYRRNSVKISNQFFNKYKKDPVFGLFFVHFPNLWGKKKFPENPA